MKIAVGTTSRQKLDYLEEILNELDIEAELISFGVNSNVSEQPISLYETKIGSINRAKSALRESDNADIAIGIEVGYHPNKDGDYKILCWATVTDVSGRLVSTPSHRLLLPSFYQQVLRDDRDLCQSIDQYLDENPDDLAQKLGMIIKFRKPFIQTSIRLALFEYFLDN